MNLLCTMQGSLKTPEAALSEQEVYRKKKTKMLPEVKILQDLDKWEWESSRSPSLSALSATVSVPGYVEWKGKQHCAPH